ncbi:MAG: hypothetical protein C0599_09780 [Salinivirgaceae bacterium]|nr:MAG: hypothetical protein C0599_09780 [Salinivirgaceae bacterium]
MNAIETILDMYYPITLKEMDNVKLMNRVDTKFVCSPDLLPIILFDVLPYYKVLDINDNRIMPYRTIYFDTPDFKMYTQHQNGKLNRYKVRNREYSSSDLHFMEIKFKNNKGRTIKNRIPVSTTEDYLKLNELLFVDQNTPYEATELEAKLWNSFKRITLVGHNERITIDYGLCFSDVNGFDKKCFEIAVIETKQSSRNLQTGIARTLKENGIRPQNFSKYCMGASVLFNHLKSNRLKLNHLIINKISA